MARSLRELLRGRRVTAWGALVPVVTLAAGLLARRARGAAVRPPGRGRAAPAPARPPPRPPPSPYPTLSRAAALGEVVQADPGGDEEREPPRGREADEVGALGLGRRRRTGP